MILGLMLSSGLAYAADTSPSSPTTGHPAVLSYTECNGVWMDAAGGGDVLAGDKAGGYVSDFKQADANQDGNISQAEFKEACKKGLTELSMPSRLRWARMNLPTKARLAKSLLLSRARCRGSRQILHPSEQLVVTVRFLSDGTTRSPVLKPGASFVKSECSRLAFVLPDCAEILPSPALLLSQRSPGFLVRSPGTERARAE
jgi:hypothetical protein